MITDIWKFDLRRGNSTDPREGACLLDAVSWLEYGTMDDHPPCVCPVIAAFGRGINDAVSDVNRQRLKVFIPRLVGTVDPAAELERVEFLAWQAIRVFAPLMLDALFPEKAKILREFRGTLKDAAATIVQMVKTMPNWAAAAQISAAIAGSTASNADINDELLFRDGVDLGRRVEAAISAGTCARVVGAHVDVSDAVILALEGVLKIGRQAEPIPAARFSAAIRSFELASS